MKTVSSLTVLKAFVLADLINLSRGKKRYLGEITKEELEKKVIEAKKKLSSLSRAQLERKVRNPVRLKAYTKAKWTIRTLSVKELGTWRGAGGLPISWTEGTLDATAKKVSKGLRTNSKLIRARSKRSLKSLLNGCIDVVEKEKLYPIVFASGVGTQGRRKLHTKVKGDIDDGNMRALAMVLRDKKRITVYFGKD